MTMTTIKSRPRARGPFAVRSMIRFAIYHGPYPAKGRWRKRFTGPATDKRLARLVNDWRGLSARHPRFVQTEARA